MSSSTVCLFSSSTNSLLACSSADCSSPANVYYLVRDEWLENFEFWALDSCFVSSDCIKSESGGYYWWTIRCMVYLCSCVSAAIRSCSS